MTMAGKPFVFMHYSNPTKDSKRLENRQKVAKYAMLGRQKPSNGPKGHQATSPSTRSRPSNGTNGASNSNLNAASSNTVANGVVGNGAVANGEDWSSIEHLTNGTRIEASPDPSSNASTISTNSYSTNYGSSPQSIAFSQEGYSPNSAGFEALPDGCIYDFNSSGNSAVSETSEELNGFNQGGNNPSFFSSSMEFPTQSFQAQLHALGNNLSATSHNYHPSNRIMNKKRQQAKKRRNSYKSSVRTSISGQNPTQRTDLFDDSIVTTLGQPIPNNEGDRPQRSLNPKSLLSASTTDPFNSLPIPANAHTWELLYQYMNARLISSVYAQGGSETSQRIKKMRQTVWWPLCARSEASCYALVAYVESTPNLPIKSPKKDFLYEHVGAAVAAVNKALSEPGAETNDSVCFAVVLLMLTAQREGSTDTYRTHADGLAQLLSHRTKAIRRNGEQDNTVEQLRSFYAGEMRDRCRYCQNAYNGRATSPALSIASDTTVSVSSETGLPVDNVPFEKALIPRGEGFRELIRHGFLSQSMTQFVEPAMIWSTLAERARRDKLSAAVGATHAWIDEGEFTLKGSIHPLDMACFTAVRLCFYLSSWLDWQHSCSAVRRMADAVYQALSKADNLELLLQRCPYAMLWLALMVGPLCDGEARQGFLNLLVRSRDALNLQNPLCFETCIDDFSRIYVWSHTMTPGAERFWNEPYFSESMAATQSTDTVFELPEDGGLWGF